jgi:radical SAM protein with 4Fe4S-binding SPASM domain
MPVVIEKAQGNTESTLAPPFAPDFRPRVWREVMVDDAEQERDGYLLLMHPFEPRWLPTNQTGLMMARVLDGTLTVEQAVSTLAEKVYQGVDEQRLASDMREFLIGLHGANLLENAPLPRAAGTPKPPGPPSVTIYVTEQCNLRCKHCAIVEGRMPESLLTADEIRRIIREHTASYPGATVSFLGGEPLMHPDCLDLLDYAAQHTTAVNITTNGHYVTPEVARRLAASCSRIQVSFDGADPAMHDYIRGKGSFEKALQAVRNLVDAGAAKKTGFNTTLTRCAVAQVRELVALADDLGIAWARFLPLHKTKAASTNWDIIAPDAEEFKHVMHWLLFEAKHRANPVSEASSGFPGFVPNPDLRSGHWCPLGRTLIVTSQGTTYNCPILTSKEVTVGNALRATTEQLLDGERNKAGRDFVLRRKDEVEECRQCAWRNFCQGGCTAYMANTSGSLVKNDEFCDFRRDLYREHVRRTLAIR